jgi:hypothetical protein
MTKTLIAKGDSMTTTNAAAGAAGRWATGTGEVNDTGLRRGDPWILGEQGVCLLRAGAGGSLSSQFDHDPLPVLAAPGPGHDEEDLYHEGRFDDRDHPAAPPTIRAEARGDR